jgi:hypothetical protein
MLVNPDFSEIQEEVVPGSYKCTIKKADVKDWPNGGTYINWALETFGEPEPKNNGRTIFHKTSVSGKGAFMLQKFYKAATGQALTGKFDTEQLLGKRIEVQVVDGVRNGEPTGYTEVKNVKPVSVQ